MSDKREFYAVRFKNRGSEPWSPEDLSPLDWWCIAEVGKRHAGEYIEEHETAIPVGDPCWAKLVGSAPDLVCDYGQIELRLLAVFTCGL